MTLGDASNKQAEAPLDPESLRAELDRRTFHLQTLNEISRELFGIKDAGGILRAFLLMTMGNFGLAEGCALFHAPGSGDADRWVSVGLDPSSEEDVFQSARRFMDAWDGAEAVLECDALLGPRPFPENVGLILPFGVGQGAHGVLGLGRKILGHPYDADDRELLVTLKNSLVLSLKNALAFEDTERLNRELAGKNSQLETTLGDLDRRAYHLRTLYDVSHEIFGSVEIKAILKNFLMMTLGNFGVMEGVLLVLDRGTRDPVHLEKMGYPEEGLAHLLAAAHGDRESPESRTGIHFFAAPDAEGLALGFSINEDFSGVLGLGPKLVGEPYGKDDRELLTTLVNNLVIALKNARSFEDIKTLNRDLEEKNEALRKALDELKAALRKVEILEGIKANLSKFVPTTVTRLLETSTEEVCFDAAERDVSVMFVDMEGYTAITERLGAAEVNVLVEKYFSVFMDAIYENNGDVVETSGDGLMILYMSDDERTNALEAVRSALMILEKTCSLEPECTVLGRPIKINIGISSGRSVVGANKFECYTGSRWTYTCHGTPINVAARICGQARGGELMLSRETAERVRGAYPLTSKGEFSLKNLTEKVEIYTIDDAPAS